MSMKYVRDTYGVPAKRGMFVQVFSGCRPDYLVYEGRISSASHYIHVDGMPFHPTDNVVYFDNEGNILHDTREAKNSEVT